MHLTKEREKEEKEIKSEGRKEGVKAANKGVREATS